MKRLVHTIVALLGCLHLCGGHWGVMQVVAWANMIVDYSAQDGLLTGARKTFDGSSPCEMCKSIAEGKEQESGSKDGKTPQIPQGLVLKDCVVYPISVISPPPPRDCVVLSAPAAASHARALGHRPPVPPPRLA